MRHVAVFGTDPSLSSPFMQDLLNGNTPAYFPEILGKKGMLFSNITLTWFMEEERKHDRFDLTEQQHRSIRSLSSGEQKKALLNYLLAGNPDFLVLDNPFDALDAASSCALQEDLGHLSRQLMIIQIVKRARDLLPFITHALSCEGDRVVFSGTIREYLEKYEIRPRLQLHGRLPAPSRLYPDIPDSLIKFENVSVSYEERPILKDINWEVGKGEFWELVGPNGVGKTTMLTMITGDNPKAFGQDLFLFGRKKGTGESVWQIKEKVGYLTPSMLDLFHRRTTVEQMIISGMVDSIGLYRQASGLQTELAGKWIRLLDLENERHAPFISLSQVHQRMVLVARAMVKHPPVLILDEPGNGLDDKAAAMLTALINKMAEESDTAIIYVSHRQEPGLKSHSVFELFPGQNGSTGKRR